MKAKRCKRLLSLAMVAAMFLSMETGVFAEDVSASDTSVAKVVSQSDVFEKSTEDNTVKNGSCDKITQKKNEDTIHKANLVSDNSHEQITRSEVNVSFKSNDDDFVIEDGVLDGYNGYSKDVVIPDGVTKILSCYGSFSSLFIPASVKEIEEDAFSYCPNLLTISVDNNNTFFSTTDGVLFNKEKTKLLLCPPKKEGEYIIPNTVRIIGDASFESCSKLTSITIPSSVTRIGDYAFSSCNGLNDIAIPSSVKEIGEFAFCNSISSISVDENNPFFTSDDNVLYDKQKTNIYFFPKQKTGEYVIPNSVKKIRSALFYECKGLTSVIIPNSVTEIGDGAFYNCDGLESIAIPNSVTKIGEWTFYKCEGLKSIVIPNSVEEIGDYSFCDCKQLTSFTFSNSISVISEGLLSECTNLKKIEIPESVTTIKWFAFSDCKSLQNVVIPNSVKNIEWYVFSNCTNLKSIVIPESVENIGSGIFSGCTSLESVTLPVSFSSDITSIFQGCEPLPHIAFSASEDGNITIDGVIFNSDKTKILYCDKNKKGAYTIPDSVKEICDAAFEGCTGLTDITFPTSVMDIGNSAFRSCTGLTNLNLPYASTPIGSGVYQRGSTIHNYAFADCTGLKSVSISSVNILSCAFANCENLSSIELTDKVGTINSQAFANCIALKEIFIPKSVDFIGEQIFSGCTALEKVDVDSANSVYTSMDGVLFNKNKSELIFYPYKKSGGYVIPNTVTTINEDAFTDCDKLTSLSIPSTVNTLPDCISYLAGLTSITVDSNNEYYSSLNGVLFDKNQTQIICYPQNKKGAYTIPDTVSNIDNCFGECKGLTAISIPDSVTSMNWSFYGCTSLSDVTIPDSVESMEGAFIGCIKISSVNIPDFVTNIEESFGDCEALSSISVDSNNKNYSSRDGVLYNKNQTKLILCPMKKSGIYSIPQTVQKIGHYAFDGCSNLTEIGIPNSVNVIGSHAFARSGINNIIIPSSVLEIGEAAFSDCINLKKIYILCPDSDITRWLVRACDNLTDIYFSGTYDQWNKFISRAEERDIGLNDNVTIHYNYVPTSLSITSHPATVTSKVNDNVSFSVKAQGDGLTYQWFYKKAGQTAWNKWGTRTTATTTATANATWNGIQVYCKVTDQYGNSVDSNPATITIKQDLKITAQPTDKTVKLGESLTLSVKAEGIGLTYQWYYKKSGATSFSKWNGRTHASETVTPNASWNGIQLYCTVKDSSGNSLDSSVAKITVTQDLKITAQPTNKTIKKGDSVTLSLKAEGTGLTYQWYYKKAGATSFSTWNGRTHASETVTPNTTWNGIQLYCVVKDSSGKKVQSNTIKVLFSDVVTIVTQPTNVTAKTGDNVTFKFVAEGVGLTYQWYYKKAGATAWSKWNGRTTASTTATANASWDGMQVYCVVKNSSGSTLNSNIAKITLSDVLAITQQPSNVTTQAGQNVTFTVKAKGVGLKYQWQYKKSGQASWSNWGARTTASTTATSNATWNGMQVRCIVTDSAGNKITSNAATITIK